ncbi:YraN family protein [Oscillospiraceae bacterium OttesenSCG-928-F05]|nr:YraN family protein [Oscillospiraceae bacterium OttesenSCG-928-F05]
MKPSEAGRLGEDAVAEFLEARGYTVLQRNYRSRYGEIDVIASDSAVVAFVEVKLRKNNAFAEAREFVDGRKQTKLRTTAAQFLMENPMDRQPRFDVAEVLYERGRALISYYENAFE